MRSGSRCALLLLALAVASLEAHAQDEFSGTLNRMQGVVDRAQVLELRDFGSVLGAALHKRCVLDRDEAACTEFITHHPTALNASRWPLAAALEVRGAMRETRQDFAGAHEDYTGAARISDRPKLRQDIARAAAKRSAGPAPAATEPVGATSKGTAIDREPATSNDWTTEVLLQGRTRGTQILPPQPVAILAPAPSQPAAAAPTAEAARTAPPSSDAAAIQTAEAAPEQTSTITTGSISPRVVPRDKDEATPASQCDALGNLSRPDALSRSRWPHCASMVRIDALSSCIGRPVQASSHAV